MATSRALHPTLIPLPDELRSGRVLLRPLAADDAEAVFTAVVEARDHLRPWMDWVDNHRTLDDSRDYCLRCAANWLLRSDLTVGMFDPATGDYLGGTGLHRMDWEVRAFEIGYWIRPSAEGRGYVGEAVGLLAGLAFEWLDARRLEIRCDATNERSRRVAERAGFVFEGTLRNDSLTSNGEVRSSLIFSLIPEDYARIRGETSDGVTTA